MTIKELPADTRLIQLAEESAELSQAALKMIRARNGDTPVTEEDASRHLTEEIADVLVCVFSITDIASSSAVGEIVNQKAQRWEERINGEG